MTTRKIALAVDDDVLPAVASELAARGIVLGPAIEQVGDCRCYDAVGKFPITVQVDLSERDRRMLEGFADGKPMAAIASGIGLTESSAHTHAHRLYRKLGANSRQQAVAIAYRMGALNAWKATA